jgi:hypothetical protein
MSIACPSYKGSFRAFSSETFSYHDHRVYHILLLSTWKNLGRRVQVAAELAAELVQVRCHLRQPWLGASSLSVHRMFHPAAVQASETRSCTR